MWPVESEPAVAAARVTALGVDLVTIVLVLISKKAFEKRTHH
jgi:hypothetical protein